MVDAKGDFGVYDVTMTKADIVENVYEKVGGFSKKEAAEIVETVFDTIKETLERGEKIKISGFGNFVVRDKNARAGRNPQTGQEITISARRVLTFKPSQVLKNVLNDCCSRFATCSTTSVTPSRAPGRGYATSVTTKRRCWCPPRRPRSWRSTRYERSSKGSRI